MSVYIVNDGVIDCIVDGFIKYDVKYSADNFHMNYTSDSCDLDDLRNAIGESLVKYNYLAFSYRYNEKNKAHEYEYQGRLFNVGELWDSIGEYIYQVSSLPYYDRSSFYYSLMRLKDKIATDLIRDEGYDIDNSGVRR